jgi:hypothetical protein
MIEGTPIRYARVGDTPDMMTELKMRFSVPSFGWGSVIAKLHSGTKISPKC